MTHIPEVTYIDLARLVDTLLHRSDEAAPAVSASGTDGMPAPTLDYACDALPPAR